MSKTDPGAIDIPARPDRAPAEPPAKPAILPSTARRKALAEERRQKQRDFLGDLDPPSPTSGGQSRVG
jgi:hypothetical protein